MMVLRKKKAEYKKASLVTMMLSDVVENKKAEQSIS